MLKLFTYYRSVSTFRVRIALNYKQIPYEPVFIDEDSGEHLGDTYLRMNPQGLVPALLVDDDQIITQSAAILEYLEERYPERALLPSDAAARARVRSLSQLAVADMNPLLILRVFHYMRDELGLDKPVRRTWYEHWAHNGFKALEASLADHPETGAYCHGERPTLADVCLVPQVYNAEKNGLDLAAYPVVRRIYRTCMTLASFQAAAPEAQRDLLNHA